MVAMGRFGPTKYIDYHEIFSKIKKTKSLRDYQKDFKYLFTRVHEWLEKALIGFFVGVMKIELAIEVKLKKLKTLIEALLVTWIKEDQLRDWRKK